MIYKIKCYKIEEDGIWKKYKKQKVNQYHQKYHNFIKKIK